MPSRRAGHRSCSIGTPCRRSISEYDQPNQGASRPKLALQNDRNEDLKKTENELERQKIKSEKDKK